MQKTTSHSCCNSIPILTAGIACAVLFFVLSFFLTTVIAAFSPLWDSTTSSKAIISKHLLLVTLDTCKIALGSTGIALLIGLPAAFFIANRSFPGKKQLLACSAVPLCIPALIIALGYITWLGNNGLANTFFMKMFHLKDKPFHFLYSYTGIIIAQGFYNFPLIMGTVANAWEQLPTTEADAARLLGASETRVFFTITLHQLVTIILSACIPVFLYCFFGFMIILLFGSVGCTTLEVEIYRTARATLDFKTTSSLAIFETLIALLVVTISTLSEQHNQKSKGLTFIYKKTQPLVRSFYEVGLFGIVMLTITFFFLLPLGGIIISGFLTVKGELTFHIFKALCTSSTFISACRNTLIVACATGILCVIVAATYTILFHLIQKKAHVSKLTTIAKIVSVIPMALSSVVFGFGLSLIVRQGNPLLLVVAQTMLYWPFAYRQIYPYLARIPQQTEEAASLLSASVFDTIYAIYLPTMKQGMFNAFCFCFAISVGDTTLPLVLSLPRFDTLALYTYRLASAYKFNQACASGTILGLICATVFALSQKRKVL